MIIDQRDIDQLSARQIYGIHHSWRSDDIDTRYYDHMAREGMYKLVISKLVIELTSFRATEKTKN
jgi:hypothetical protein